MKHLVSYRNRIVGACAVAAVMALASPGFAHGAMGMGAMGMGARGGMAMQPPSAGPRPFDPSGHLNGPTNPSTPRQQPTPSPSAPRLDPPGGNASMSGGGMAAQPPSAGPRPFDPSGHLNGPVNAAPGAPRTQPTPSAPRLDPPGNDASMSGGPRTHAPFHNPNTTGGKLSGDVNVSPDAPQLDPK
jgi:hypothetical protein